MITRRDFMATAALSAPALSLRTRPRGKRVAAIQSVYRLRSHAYHISGRFIFGYPVAGVHHQPEFKLVRMFSDQYPANDLSRDLAPRHGFEIAGTV